MTSFGKYLDADANECSVNVAIGSGDSTPYLGVLQMSSDDLYTDGD
jgi:hypothetical protein